MKTEIHEVIRDERGRVQSIVKPAAPPPSVTVHMGDMLKQIRDEAYTRGIQAGINAAVRAATKAVAWPVFNAGREFERENPGAENPKALEIGSMDMDITLGLLGPHDGPQDEVA